MTPTERLAQLQAKIDAESRKYEAIQNKLREMVANLGGQVVDGGRVTVFFELEGKTYLLRLEE